MKTSRILSVLALFAITTFAAACGGEDEPAGDAQPDATGAEQTPATGEGAAQGQLDPEMMQRMMEVQEIQQRLGPIEQEAMQDPELTAQLESIQQQVETAMRAEDEELFDRMDELEAEFTEAQEAENQERIQEISQEAQGMQMQLQEIQQRVLEDPELQAEIDAFEEARRARMIEIDPEAGELMDRIDEIMDELDMG